MLSKLKAAIPASTKKRLRELTGSNAYAITSYGQEGEDILLARIFNDGKPGTYIDVGAHHPVRFSNTYKFYRLGWRGINIDAMPGSMKPFRQHRPHDINLEVGIASVTGQLSFNIFDEPALNTFDAECARERENNGFPVRRRVPVECMPLSEILRRNPFDFKNTNSFLSIDVEGLDLQVLKSNDWSQYKPSIIVAESAGKDITQIVSGEMAVFLQSHGYTIFSKLAHSVFFKASSFHIR